MKISILIIWGAIAFGGAAVAAQGQVLAPGICKIKFKPGIYAGAYFVNNNMHQGERTVRLASGATYRLGITANELPNGGIDLAVSDKCKITSVSNTSAVSFEGRTIYFKNVPDLNSGLTAWWRGEGNATDSSGNERHGMEVGRVSYEVGKAGSAFKFNNVSPSLQGIYFQNPRGAVLPQNAGTVTLWLNWSFKTAGQNEIVFGGCLSLNPGQCTATTPILGIVGEYSLGWWFGMNKRANQSTVNDVDRCYGMYPVPVGQWRHAAITYKKRADVSYYDITFYVDGRKIGSQCDGLFPMGGDIPWQVLIGGGSGLNEPGFNGLVDEVRTYNRILSESEIEAIFKYER